MFTVGGLNYNQIVLPISMTIICWYLLTITVLMFFIILVKIFNLEQPAGSIFSNAVGFTCLKEVIIYLVPHHPHTLWEMGMGVGSIIKNLFNLIKESGSSETTNSHRNVQRVIRKDVVQIRKSPLINKTFSVFSVFS